MSLGIGTAGLIATGLSTMGNMANSGFSNAQSTQNSENWSDSYGGSYNVSAQDTMNFANSWTEAKEANENAAYQAELNRIYQTYMSNTAYQRAVADLKAAGLNPILAYTNGPASTPAGSTAQSFMNSYANSYGESHGYSEGGSSQESHSYGYNNSQSTSNSQPGWYKVISGAKELLTGTVNMIDQNLQTHYGIGTKGGGGHKF